MDKHGDFFPENPQNIDELLDTLAQRSAAAQRMLNSMSPEQREELMQLSAQAFGVAGADAVAGPDGRQPAGAATRRGLGRRRSASRASRASGSATAPASSRTSPTSTTWPTSSPSPTPARGWTTSTSTSSPASSATRPPSTRAPCSELEQALRDSGYLRARLRRRAAAHAQGDAPARQGAAARRGQTDVRPPGPARRCARPVRRASCPARPGEWAFGDTEPWDITAHGRQRRTPSAADGGSPAAYARASRTSRSPRPRRAPRRRSRCSSTRPSRWRWTAAGCR